MSRGACEVVKITTGRSFSSGSALTSARTARPSLRGRLRSSMTRSGRLASANCPQRCRNCSACSPSGTVLTCAGRSLVARTSQVRLASAGLSSTNRILCAELIVFCLISFIGYCSRKREPKIASAAQFGLDPNSSAIVLHDFFTDGQSHAVTCVLTAGMEALENLENQISVFFGNANAIVGDRKQPFTGLLFSGNGHAGIMLGAKFDGVADQILEKLH